MNILVCPRCRFPLAIKSHGANRVAGCSKCGGIWLGAAATQTVGAALSPIARTAATNTERTAAMRPVDEEAPAPCAECRTPMQRHAVGPVEVDHCAQHGTWYDAGELNEVARILEGQAAEAAGEAPPAPGPTGGVGGAAPTALAAGADGNRRLNEDSLARAKRIASLCRSADHATERSHQEARVERARRWTGDRHGTSGIGDVFDLVSDVMIGW